MQSVSHASKHTYLALPSIHRAEVFSKLLAQDEVHVEVLEGGEGADIHRSRGDIMCNLLGRFQQAHDFPQSIIDIWQSK